MQRSWRPTRRRFQFDLRSWLGARLSSRLRLTGAATGLLLLSSGLTLSALAAASATAPELAMWPYPGTTGVTCNTSGPTSADPTAPIVYSTNAVCAGVSGVTPISILDLSAENLTAGSTGSIEECNDDPSQPIEYYLGTSVPISCTPVVPTTVGSDGTLSGTKAVRGGTLAAPATVGPPVSNTLSPGITPSCIATQSDHGTTTTSSIPNCTTSGNITTDAANFPCPPTAAQRAVGITCIFAIGDQAGDHAVGLLLWAGETVPTSATSTASESAGQISDKATLNSGNIYADSPTGSVDFYVCQTSTDASALSPGTCAAAGTPQSTQSLTATGDNETSNATSAAFTPTSNGTWCFSVSYAGDSYFAGSTDNVDSTDNNECVLVTDATGTTSGPTTSSPTSSTTTTSTSTTTTEPTSTSTSTTTTSSTTTTTQPTTTTTSSTTTTTQPTTTTTSSTTTTTSTTLPPQTLTGPYELYCPGTPIGSIALNGVTTTATASPTTVQKGGTFNLTNYQTAVNIPNSLATAASALQPDLAGSASTQIDAIGATPATVPQGPFAFDVPIPSPVPPDGVTLSLPSTPGTVGPFTATADGVTIEQDSNASLTLEVAGTPLTLTCQAYPNDDVATGIQPTDPFGNPIPPPGNPIAPVIAIINSGPTTTTTGPTTTTTVGTECKPGWGNGDKNHCHSGPPGHDGGGPPQSAGGPPGGHLNSGTNASYRSSAWEGPVGPTLTLLGTVLLLLITLPRRRSTPAETSGARLSGVSMARRRDWLLGR